MKKKEEKEEDKEKGRVIKEMIQIKILKKNK